MKVFLIIWCLISHSLASVKVATVDFADLFNTHPELIAAQTAMKAKQAAILDRNEKGLEAVIMRNKKIEVLKRKIENPEIGKKEKNQYRRELYSLGNKSSHIERDRRRTLELLQKTLNTDILVEMRKVLTRIEDKTKKYAEENNIELLIDKSLKGKNKRPFLVYAATELDITKQLQAGEKASTKKGIELHKLKVATINLDHLLKQEKPEKITEIVSAYAKKNSIHLVFDSSAESTTYSHVIPSARKALDITKQLFQKSK